MRLVYDSAQSEVGLYKCTVLYVGMLGVSCLVSATNFERDSNTNQRPVQSWSMPNKGFVKQVYSWRPDRLHVCEMFDGKSPLGLVVILEESYSSAQWCILVMYM